MPFLLEEGSAAVIPAFVHVLWPTHRTDGALLPKQKMRDTATNSFKDRRELLGFPTKQSEVKVIMPLLTSQTISGNSAGLSHPKENLGISVSCGT